MTAYPEDIAAVKLLLPVRIDVRSWRNNIMILDRDDNIFCLVPTDNRNARHCAVMIVSAINALADEFVPGRSHHGL